MSTKKETPPRERGRRARPGRSAGPRIALQKGKPAEPAAGRAGESRPRGCGGEWAWAGLEPATSAETAGLYHLSYQAREMVPREGLEPPCPRAAVPKTAVSAVSPSRRENGRGQHGSQGCSFRLTPGRRLSSPCRPRRQEGLRRTRFSYSAWPQGAWVSVLPLATSALFLKERAGPTRAARRRCRPSACGRVPDDHPRPPSGASTFGARPIPKVPTHRQPRHPVANRRRLPTSTFCQKRGAESSRRAVSTPLSPAPPLPLRSFSSFCLSL